MLHGFLFVYFHWCFKINDVLVTDSRKGQQWSFCAALSRIKKKGTDCPTRCNASERGDALIKLIFYNI
jgi:hypothetical protein